MAYLDYSLLNGDGEPCVIVAEFNGSEHQVEETYAGVLLSVVFPAALNAIFACVSIMVTNTLAALYDDISIVAIGIVKRVEMLPHNVGGIFNILLLFIMNHRFGLYGIVWTRIIADALTVILSLFICKRTIPKPEQAQRTG